jgi:hypothetical protein
MMERGGARRILNKMNLTKWQIYLKGNYKSEKKKIFVKPKQIWYNPPIFFPKKKSNLYKLSITCAKIEF